LRQTTELLRWLRRLGQFDCGRRLGEFAPTALQFAHVLVDRFPADTEELGDGRDGLHDRDEVLDGAAGPVQGRGNEGVAFAEAVECLRLILMLGVLAGLLVGAARFGEGVDLPVE
jgi:hypothetical protein